MNEQEPNDEKQNLSEETSPEIETKKALIKEKMVQIEEIKHQIEAKDEEFSDMVETYVNAEDEQKYGLSDGAKEEAGRMAFNIQKTSFLQGKVTNETEVEELNNRLNKLKNEIGELLLGK